MRQRALESGESGWNCRPMAHLDLLLGTQLCFRANGYGWIGGKLITTRRAYQWQEVAGVG